MRYKTEISNKIGRIENALSLLNLYISQGDITLYNDTIERIKTLLKDMNVLIGNESQD